MSEAVFLKLLDLALQVIAALVVMWTYDKRILKPRYENGADPLIGAITNGHRELLHAQDVGLTRGFEQLRRDLTTTNEKTIENAIMRYLMEADLRPERRRGR